MVSKVIMFCDICTADIPKDVRHVVIYDVNSKGQQKSIDLHIGCLRQWMDEFLFGMSDAAAQLEEETKSQHEIFVTRTRPERKQHVQGV